MVLPSGVNDAIHDAVMKVFEGVVGRLGCKDSADLVLHVAAGKFEDPPFQEEELRQVRKTFVAYLSVPLADRGAAEGQSS